MLIELEVELKLPIVLRLCLHAYRFKQFVDVISDKQGVSKDSHDFNNWPSDIMLTLDDADEAICDDGNVNLNANGIFAFSPERLDLEVLLNPFEEEFDLPSVSVKKRNVRSLEVEVVRIVCERPSEVCRIIDNPSDGCRIIVGISLADEAYGLVSDDIVLPFKYILTSLNLVVRAELFPDDEEGSRLFDGIETGKVKVSSVKHITCQLFILQPVHGVEVADIRITDSIEYRDFCKDVNLRVYLDSRFCTSELCPSEYGKAKVDGGGVNCKESSVKFEILCDTELLCPSDHVEGKLLVDSVIPEGIGLGNDIPVWSCPSEAEVIGAFSMSAYYIRKFPEAGTASKLAEDKHEKMVPMGERPSPCPIVVLLHDTVELTLEWSHHLLEYVLPCMHNHTIFDSGAKVRISKAGQHIEQLKRCA